MSENKLNVIDLHKRYGEHEVLKGVSLQANAGDVISIIGSSGSGKSTFLRCINFLEKPSEGSIVVNGQTINLVRDKDGQLKVADKNQLRLLRTRLTMVFQHFNLWSHMTVLENVMEAPIQVLGGEVSGKSWDRRTCAGEISGASFRRSATACFHRKGAGNGTGSFTI